MEDLHSDLLRISTTCRKVSEYRIGRSIFEDVSRGYKAAWTIKVRDEDSDFDNLRDAADRIAHSNIPVAFPTETVYGLGADATRSQAVLGIFKAKGRPSDNPLIVHIAELDQLRRALDPSYTASFSADPIPRIYLPLIEKFWPGPLTIICPLKKDSTLASEVTAGLPTVGFRMPASPIALGLIKLAGVPVAAPSANTSSRPSATTAEHVLEDLSGRIEIVLDGGPCHIGVESTIVDGLTSPPSILRPGRIRYADVASTVGWHDVILSSQGNADGNQPKAPGMKYKHYAPKAPVLLMQRGTEQDVIQHYLRSEKSLGVLWVQGQSLGGTKAIACNPSTVKNSRFQMHEGCNSSSDFDGIPFGSQDGSISRIFEISIGPFLEDVEQRLFTSFRAFDQHAVSRILVQEVEADEQNESAAIRNRIHKAISGYDPVVMPPRYVMTVLYWLISLRLAAPVTEF